MTGWLFIAYPYSASFFNFPVHLLWIILYFLPSCFLYTPHFVFGQQKKTPKIFFWFLMSSYWLIKGIRLNVASGTAYPEQKTLLRGKPCIKIIHLYGNTIYCVRQQNTANRILYLAILSFSSTLTIFTSLPFLRPSGKFSKKHIL